MVEVPREWRRLLAELQEHDPKAILAGGAIRDLICGKKPRDLDFWVTDSAAMLHTAKWGHRRNITQSHPEYLIGHGEDDCLVLQVYEVRIPWWLSIWNNSWRRDLPINIMWCANFASPLELIEKFDFGICMVAYDGHNIIRSRHFDHDFENKVFTLRRALDANRIAKSTMRYESKFKDKYGWPMELSGQARLDRMLNAMNRKVYPPSPDLSGEMIRWY